MKQNFLPILSAFVVISSIIFLFTPLHPQLSFVQPELKLIGTPTPTSAWQTYTSDELGFSYQYPSNWQLINDSHLFGIENKKDGTIIQIFRHSVSELPTGYTSIAVWYTDFFNKKQKSILPNDGYYYGPGGDNPYKWYMYFKMENSKGIRIDNISSITAPNTGTGLQYIIVPTTNYVYEIVINPIKSYETSDVDQILSTFKFTN